MLLLNPNASQLPAAPCGQWGRFAQAQLIVFVTTHELLHQWFGDTVTMRWWSQEYLNEGFARLMQSYGSDDLVPEWDAMCLTGQSQAGQNNFFRFSYEVAQIADATGTAPAIVYPLPGGGDVPAFPPSAPWPSNTTNKRRLLPHGHGQGNKAAPGRDVTNPAESPLFSRMFYEKGASVNRMVGMVANAGLPPPPCLSSS